MRKIVINSYYGGYGFSDLALEEYFKKQGKPMPTEAREINDLKYNIKRDDPVFLSVIEKLGDLANSPDSSLKNN